MMLSIDKEMVMFDAKELKVIASALVVQEKSVNRLAGKEGQPENVAMEYRKVSGEIASVLKKVTGLIITEEAGERNKARRAKKEEQPEVQP